jgi:hypothetical protein
MRAWRVYPEAALAAVVLVAALAVVALAFVDVWSAGIAALIAVAIGAFAMLGWGRRG